MASVADSHAAVPAGAGTPPQSGSPVAAKRAATAWKRPENGPVPVLMATAIMDADSWPALPGLVSPPPLPGLVSPPPPTPPKASPKAAPPPSSTGGVIPPVSLVDSGALDANSDHEALLDSPPARRASVFSEGDGLEIRAPGPDPSPVYSPNARSNGVGDHRHQNGRFGSHLHGRSGGYGGGNRRGNGGGGGRHGHEYHGGFDGQRRGSGRRDGHGPGHQQRGHQPSSYIRAPPPLAVMAAAPPTPPFVGPAAPQTPPYGPPMSFPEMAPHVYYFAVPHSDGLQAIPFVPPPPTPPPAMLVSPFEHLQRQLLVQIEYYFSDENLCKDIYLRQHMDDQGWVPVSLIACFNQVKNFLHRIAQVRTLVNTLQFILDTVRQSLVVEVQGDKIRRRARWEIWLLPRSNYSAGNSSGSLSPVTSNIDSLASQFQSVGLEGSAYHPNMQAMPGEAFLARSATSVSIGYQEPTFGGLHSNGSGAIFGQRTARSLLRSDTF